MMDELIEHVSAKTGLSQDQTRAAVMAVIGFLKERLPAPLAGALDNLVNGQGSGTGAGGDTLAGEAESVLGALFAKKAE